MTISEQLKALRLEKKMTLKELVSNMHKFGKDFGTGNLSRWENGEKSKQGLRPKDETVLWILEKGYRFNTKKAKQMLAEWRLEEVQGKYKLHLAQPTEPYNASASKGKDAILHEYLAAEGLDSEDIKKAVKEINQIIKKYKG